MRVRLGIWHDEVAVFFDHDPGVALAVSLESDMRRLFVAEDDEHGDRAYRDTASVVDGFVWRVDAMQCEREGFSRCCLMDVHLVPTSNGGWVADLPPNHEMPWPHARDCTSYLRAEELMRECVVRRDSARDAGVHMPPPPAPIQRELTPAMRVALFS